jgi:hypothetical protein
MRYGIYNDLGPRSISGLWGIPILLMSVTASDFGNRINQKKVAMSDSFDEAQKRAAALATELKAMEWDVRTVFFDKLVEGFCRHCWYDDPGCQCANDE